MTTTMGLKEVRSELQKFDKEQLVDIAAELYKKHKAVRDFFDFYLRPDEKKLLEEYKRKVREGFYPKCGSRLRLSVSRQTITDFKKYEPHPEYLVDLMLYYVECGVEFTNDFGDIDEDFYSSLEKMFVSALELARNENILDKFEIRVKQIVDHSDGIGWGFHDSLSESYFDYYDSGSDN